MIVIIVIPLLLALYISLIDLDQYTLRRWLERAVHRRCRTSSRRYRHRACCTRSGSACSFAVLSTVVTVPLGVAAAVATQNAYRGRAWCGRSS